MAFYDFNGHPIKDMQVNSLTAHKANFHQMSAQLRGLTDAVEELADLLLQPETEPEQKDNPQPLYNGLVWRTYDGSGNNLIRPQRGKSHELLLRLAGADYGVGDVAVRGASNPSPRVVSNSICKGTSTVSAANLSDITWLWGQFVDHEIDLTESSATAPEHLNMATDPSDPNEDYGTPVRTIPFTRSDFVVTANTRDHPNVISSYIDGTNVYGSNSDRALALRRLDGSGKLKTSTANNGEVLLPYNVDELPNAMGPFGTTPSDFFLAGDVRANENAGLLAMHTLFMREHNRLCDQIVIRNPSLVGQDELIFQQARRMVCGFMQQITYGEFLPALLGSFPAYTAYDPTVDAGIATEFSTVAYRLGHTMVSGNLQTGLNPLSVVALRDVFFTPSYIQTNGANALLIGASSKLQQEIDGIVVEDLQSFLFGPPTAAMLHDLPALNIQRGRDHGIPDYNTLRVAYGLPAVSSFAIIPTSVSNQTKLQNLYSTVNDIDPWVGAIVETHLPGSSVGPLLYAMLVEQFDRLRRGDRFWYEIDPGLSDAEKAEIRNTRLSDILNRNVSGHIFSPDVFHV